MSDYIRLPLVLFITTVASAVIITLVYSITDPILEAKNLENITNALNTAYEGQDFNYEDMGLSRGNEILSGYLVTLEDGSVEYVYEVVETGKNGDISMLIAFDESGVVTSLNYININETPGIGAKVEEPEFLDTVIGQSASNPDIDTISGATISSTAVKTAVGVAGKQFEEDSQ